MLPTPTIHIDPELRRRLPRQLLARLAQRARRAGQSLAISPSRWASLGLQIVDDAEMAELHQRYMGESGPTDVLSFCPPEGPELPETLGDIVLDWDAIVRQARDGSDRSRLDEATVLLVHGLAHLLGHDHRDRREGRVMAGVEAKVLRRLGVADQPRPYAPRLLRGPAWPTRGGAHK